MRPSRRSGASTARRSATVRTVLMRAPPRAGRRRSRVAAASASNRSSRSGVRSATASRWRATVASSPRAIGPVSARRAPCAAQFSSAARASGTSASRGTPASAASRSAAPSRVTRKFEAIEAAAWYAARSSSARSKGSIPRSAASARAVCMASSPVAEIAQPAPANVAPPEVTVISGCSDEAAAGAERVEARRARTVAEQRPRGDGGGRFRDRRVGNAEQHDVASGAVRAATERAGHVVTSGAQRTGKGAAEPAAADDGDRRTHLVPVPAGDTGQGVVGGMAPGMCGSGERSVRSKVTASS